jgi:hypothetical protein
MKGWQWASEQIQIVFGDLCGQSVAALCTEYRISQAQYYRKRWVMALARLRFTT